MATFREWVGTVATFVPAFVPDNLNVRAYYWYKVLMFLSNGIVISGLLASYLYLITNSSNRTVGYIEGLLGGCALAPGVIVGWLSDKGRRDGLTRLAGLGTLLGCMLMMPLLMLADSSSTSAVGTWLERDVKGIGSVKLLLVTACAVVLYVSESAGNAVTQALASNSLVTGTRLQFFAKLQVHQYRALAVGPVISLICFAARGDTWSPENVSVALEIGLVIRLGAAAACFLFDDDQSLKTESEHVGYKAGSRTSEECVDDKAAAWVPYALFASTLVSMLGSGMTVKFFPLFFQGSPEDGGLGLSPIAVFTVLFLRPVLNSLSTKAILWLSLKIGRVQAELLFWYLGITAGFGIVWLGYTGHYTTGWGDRIAILSLYLFRCGALQCTTSVRTSIMMDYVPKHQRGRWSALQAIGQVGWSGSAALGGYLISRYSYRLVFLVTCLIHVGSTMIKFPLLCIVPKKQIMIGDIADDEVAAGDDEEDEDDEDPRGHEKAPLVN